MSVRTFLEAVLPDDGYLIVATLVKPEGKSHRVWWNNVVTSVPELQVQALTWDSAGRDAYFALASYAAKEVFNPNKKNYKTGAMGAMERRTHANALSLKSFFLDLDVKNDKPDTHYQTQADALRALRLFCSTVQLPKPSMVSSGYGLHVYWTLTENVPKGVWQPVAEKLKSACVVAGLHADAAITTDCARVLRVPGTHNFKQSAPAGVDIVHTGAATQLGVIEQALDRYLVDKAVPKGPKRSTAARAAVALPPGMAGNLGATSDPVNGNAVVFRCAAMAKIAGERGASTPYPLWWLGLGVSRFTTAPEQFALAISDGHPGFDRATTLDKASSWTGGPPTCAKFWQEDAATCEACPMWRKITTPIALGRLYREDQPTPPASTLAVAPPPPPPPPYVRVKGADGATQIYLRGVDDDDTPVNTLVSPYDIYPTRIMEQLTEEGKDAEECSAWTVHHPRAGERRFSMPQSMLSDTKKLHGFLLSRGLHVNSREAKGIQFYMTAYLKALAREADRERMFDHLGWHDDYTCYVLPDTIYHRDGTTTPHVASRAIEAVTKSGFGVCGDLAAWHQALQFYAGETNAPYRAGLYLGFAAPLYHMTGQKGVLVSASGESGRGKTTLLEAIASIYADPEAILIGGGRHGTTTNAMYAMIGTYHSLPLLWDDTTDRDSDDMGQFMLNISTGRGKERMHGNTHDGRVVTWETIVISSANTDDVNRIMASHKDSEARLMRFMSIEFNAVDRSTESKIVADKFKRSIREHYGHAGRLYIKYIVEHYDDVVRYVHKVMEQFDRELNIESQERHWSAALACMYVGGRIAYKIGASPFDPKDDLQWLKNYFRSMRLTYAQASSSPADLINEFLEAKLANTLILQAKGSNNIDNIIQRPHGGIGGLQVRRENDTGLFYVARTALNAWCEEHKANFRTIEAALAQGGVITRRNCHKVLGADTALAAGQTRCIEISRDKLEQAIGRRSTQ